MWVFIIIILLFLLVGIERLEESNAKSMANQRLENSDFFFAKGEDPLNFFTDSNSTRNLPKVEPITNKCSENIKQEFNVFDIQPACSYHSDPVTNKDIYINPSPPLSFGNTSLFGSYKPSELWKTYDPHRHEGTTWFSGNSICNSTDGYVGKVDNKGNIYNKYGCWIGKK